MSLTKARTKTPLMVSIKPRLISTGNSLPSWRHPARSRSWLIGPDHGLCEEMRHMFFINFAKAFGKENGKGLADEVLFWITEHFLGEGINKQNGPTYVDDDNPFGK